MSHGLSHARAKARALGEDDGAMGREGERARRERARRERARKGERREGETVRRREARGRRVGARVLDVAAQDGV